MANSLAAGPMVRVDAVNHYYGDGASRDQVLYRNSLQIEAGQFIVMTGPSGSGKTTLLTLIGALRTVQEGTIEVAGRRLEKLSARELTAVRRNIGFIFQLHNLFNSLTAYENVKMAMQLTGAASADIRQRSMDILSRLGLGERVDYKPRLLSGGQRQRVAIARALVNRPRLILADEPTAALDAEASRSVIALLKQLTQEQHSAVIVVTHDIRVLDYADRIVNMIDGVIISDVAVRDAVLICEFLKTVDLFKDLALSQVTSIAERMKKRRYQRGEAVIRQGEIGEEFFLVAAGRVVVTRDKPGSPGERLNTLGAGDFFGEAALVTSEPRNATLVAETELDTYVLGKDDFRAAMEANTSLKNQLLRAYFGRSTM